MIIEELKWNVTAINQQEPTVYSLLRALPDKIIMLFAPANNNFFNVLESKDQCYRILHSCFYADLIDSRNKLVLDIRRYNTIEILTGTHPAKEKFGDVGTRRIEQFCKVSYIEDLWKEILSARQTNQIDINDPVQLHLLKLIVVFLFSFLNMVKVAFGEALARSLEFIEMCLLGMNSLEK